MDWLGIDISESYLDTAVRRISAAKRGEACEKLPPDNPAGAQWFGA